MITLSTKEMPYNESYKRPENNRLCLNDETEEQELIDCGNDQVPLRNRARKIRVVQNICASMRLNKLTSFM